MRKNNYKNEWRILFKTLEKGAKIKFNKRILERISAENSYYVYADSDNEDSLLLVTPDFIKAIKELVRVK